MLKNPRHEKFAQAMSRGMTLEAAHREAGYSGDRGAACNLSKNTNISQRIEELKAENVEALAITRLNVVQFLANVITTPAGNVHKASPLCQSFKDTADCNEIRMPDKLAAVAQLCKMTGWNEPEKVESKLEILIRQKFED